MIPTIIEREVMEPWQFRMRDPSRPMVDYEHGGVAVGDTTAGLLGFDWTAEAVGGTVYLYREDLGPDTRVPLLTTAGITRLGLAFDQNMRPAVVYSTGGVDAYLWYYSGTAGAMVTITIPNAKDVCITLDDRRSFTVDQSDIIVSYVSNGKVCVRVQREGYATEHVSTISAAAIYGTGMTRALAMQWRTT